MKIFRTSRRQPSVIGVSLVLAAGLGVALTNCSKLQSASPDAGTGAGGSGGGTGGGATGAADGGGSGGSGTGDSGAGGAAGIATCVEPAARTIATRLAETSFTVS